MELKVILIDLVLILLSITGVNMYLRYVKKKFGRKSSISASAENVKSINRSFLFYLFITVGICVPLGSVGGT